MDCRQIAIAIVSCVTVVPVTTAGGQELQLISDRRQRIEIPGVSVLPPQGADWFLLPPSPQEPVPKGLLIRLFQLHGRPPARPEDSSLGFAAVMAISARSEARTAAEFLEDSRRRFPNLEVTLDDSFGTNCVRYGRVVEFTGQTGIPAPFGGIDQAVPMPTLTDLTIITRQVSQNSVGIFSVQGLRCAHPYWPEYHIDTGYQQLYAKDQPHLARGAEAEAFFKSIIFTRTRPVAYSDASQRWASHMKVGVAAHDERRWSEAEVSLQAALTAADEFGPKNPFLAMTLYYLASTQNNLDRFGDAVLLFRRALDSFEVRPTVDTPSVGFKQQYRQLYGQTLNDLGWIYSTQASRGATPSAVQSEREEAERLLQRALAVREEALGPGDIDVGQTAFVLMNLYRDWGRLTEAELAGRRALTIYERQKGADDGMVGEVLKSLSTVLRTLGREAEAQEMERRARATRAGAPTNR